ncbi:hypothetical protein Micbo1qcDRAFT_176150 [Microdochium bolleyi]|uniref:Uncharacterized protein n=1 Tax=Microdochium bolleyi TaxID=196109 RepID=A0A136IZD1_9PEZI|nr:hypothetical protein Micbo1qcDRAFT_176150 [Microdochium bolleyi]
MADDYQDSSDRLKDIPSVIGRPIGRFPHVGKKSFKAMLEQAPELHINTKEATRNALWHGTREVLKDRQLDRPPTCEQLERFIRAVPEFIKSTSRKKGDPVIAIHDTTLKIAFKVIVAFLRRTYENFALSPLESEKITSTFQELRLSGKITREATRNKLWITSLVVARMVSAMMKIAFVNGTAWWDYDLQRMCALVLQSASVTRAGDMTKSNDCDPDACLLWKHITITLSTISLLEMTVVFAHTKNFKRDPSNNKTLEFTELETDEHWLDPIVQLINLALRTGAVAERSWLELKQNMIDRPSHKIVWDYPDRPVFCAREPRGRMILALDKPAAKDILQRAIVRGAQLVGLLHAPRSHDLRRGGASELLSLTSVQENNTLARRVLGHSHAAMELDITTTYTGHITADTWSMRTRDTNTPAQSRTSATEKQKVSDDPILDDDDADSAQSRTSTIKKQKVSDDPILDDNDAEPVQSRTFATKKQKVSDDPILDDDDDGADPELDNDPELAKGNSATSTLVTMLS